MGKITDLLDVVERDIQGQIMRKKERLAQLQKKLDKAEGDEAIRIRKTIDAIKSDMTKLVDKKFSKPKGEAMDDDAIVKKIRKDNLQSAFKSLFDSYNNADLYHARVTGSLTPDEEKEFRKYTGEIVKAQNKIIKFHNKVMKSLG